MGENVVLRAEKLKKIYGQGESRVEALAGVDFEVEKGEFVAIVGASGSGKSTLLHLLGGVDKPTSGQVFIDEQDIYTLKEKDLSVLRRRKIGFIFQYYNLIPVLNVKENILMPLLLDYNKPDEEYTVDLIDLLGLNGRVDHLPSQL